MNFPSRLFLAGLLCFLSLNGAPVFGSYDSSFSAPEVKCQELLSRKITFASALSREHFCSMVSQWRSIDALLAEVFLYTLNYLDWSVDMGVLPPDDPRRPAWRKNGKLVEIDSVEWNLMSLSQQSMTLAFVLIDTLIPERPDRRSRALDLTVLLFVSKSKTEWSEEIDGDLPLIIPLIKSAFGPTLITPFGEGDAGQFNTAHPVGAVYIAFAPLLQVRVDSFKPLNAVQRKTQVFLELQSFSLGSVRQRPELYEETFCQMWLGDSFNGSLSLRAREFYLQLNPSGPQLEWSTRVKLVLSDHLSFLATSYSQCVRTLQSSFHKLAWPKTDVRP